MIFCPELNMSFETEKELFSALKTANDIIISKKKSNSITTVEKGLNFSTKQIKKNPGITAAKGLEQKEGFIYPVINTIGYLDSHNDLHVNGIWNKSAAEQIGKVHYVADHKIGVQTLIAHKSMVNIMVQDIPWSAVGYSYSGNTQALIFEIEEKNLMHEKAKQLLNAGLPIENSVRMQYVNVVLCLDSAEKEDAEFRANYDKYYPLIANKDEFEKIRYFYAVIEAKIVQESSMVLEGSNSATRTLSTKDIVEPSEDTQQKQEDDEAANRTSTLKSDEENRRILLTKKFKKNV